MNGMTPIWVLNTKSKASTTEELFNNNETKANRMVSIIFMLNIVGLLLGILLTYTGTFMLSDEAVVLGLALPILEMLIGVIVCRRCNYSRSWLKTFMLTILVIETIQVDFILNYNTTLVLLIPVIASIRYFDEKSSIKVGASTAILAGIFEFIATKVPSAIPDINFIGFKEGTQLVYRNSMIDTVLDANFNRDAYTFYYMLEGYLPKLIFITLATAICSLIAKRGREMVMDEEAISKEAARIESELALAASIQKNMLPTNFPLYPEEQSFNVYATMDPAKEVGGDFYDCFMTDDNHVAIVMADVSGKGIPAALFMAKAKALIKENTKASREIGDVLTRVNEKLCENNEEGLFVTVFAGVLDLRTGEFKYSNAGHEHPFIYKKGEGYVAYKTKAAFVLGGMEGLKYNTFSMQLEPGDCIFQYTDGVTEATDANNQLYGMDRLAAVLNANQDKLPVDLLPAVKKDVDEFVGEAPQFDDLTMLCIKYAFKK